MAAILAIACYVVGYLIVVLNENANGFLETGLMKSRAISAGIVFIFFTVLPISITEGAFFRNDSNPESNKEKWARFLLGLSDYVAAGCVAAFAMMRVLADWAQGVSISSPRFAICLTAIVWVISANAWLRAFVLRDYRKKPNAWIIFSLISICTLALSVYCLRGAILFRTFVWTFGVSALVNPFLSDIKRGKYQFKPIALIPAFLGAIAIYSIFLFPHMSATWGGGAPVSTTVYLSKDSPVHPNQKVNASLLEASDSGFYFVFEGEQQTTFVPRNLVIAMAYQPPRRLFK